MRNIRYIFIYSHYIDYSTRSCESLSDTPAGLQTEINLLARAAATFMPRACRFGLACAIVMFAMPAAGLKLICNRCQPGSKAPRYHQYVAIVYGPHQKEFSMNKLIATLIAATFAMGTAFAATPATPATPAAAPAAATAPAATAPEAMPAPTKTVAKKSAHMKKAKHAKKRKHAAKKAAPAAPAPAAS